MSRLDRFGDHRWIGTRDTMRVYDCDDAADFEALSQRLGAADLFHRDLLQTFAPDELPEARNRGFRPT